MLRFQHILPTLKGVEGLIPYDKNGISIQPLLLLPTLKGVERLIPYDKKWDFYSTITYAANPERVEQ